MVKDFPGGPVVKTGLPWQGVWVQSLVLVREVRSPHAMRGRRERKEGRRGGRVSGRQEEKQGAGGHRGPWQGGGG